MKFAEIYRDIYHEPIADHEQLDEQLFQTTYENGVQVIVNYSQNPATVNGETIEGFDYVVMKEERKKE